MMSEETVVRDFKSRGAGRKHCRPETGRTKQEFKEQADIQTILAPYRGRAPIDVGRLQKAIYADYTSADDYLDKMIQLRAAKEAFEALPNHIRRRFGNDPSQLLEFVGQAANTEEAIKLGILPEPEEKIVPKPQQVVIVGGEDPPNSDS